MLLNKNKAVLSLALGLAMVYGAGTISVYASPNEQLPEKPSIVQAQEHNQNQKPSEETCKNSNHLKDPNCRKNHPSDPNCKLDEKKPLPPQNNEDQKRPMPTKKHLEESKKPLPPQAEDNKNIIPDTDR
ncbi:hypothetical protein SPSIL_054540 [Sporomusa silvacetica DSM 10669]|uniref:Uncharacterized protein n=1 Tax=Sporomusa silvacetica DSM 10669 TaxID=1123289 RepID=A0ABZ3IV29_9FIRM|nr:hypothetical protein [Sporomusa silvacetica]OZC21097.1 hypothetical protein SPSIL_11360 [Sporomusa silvacetica DSM 10669]